MHRFRSTLAIALLLIFVYPFVLKGVHKHDIDHVDTGNGCCTMHPEQEVCQIFEFDYISFIVDDFSPMLEMFPMHFERYDSTVVMLSIPPKHTLKLRGPPTSHFI
jgi:hypothetical protein